MIDNKKLDSPKFTIGELVNTDTILSGNYFDVDPEFMNSEEWYDSSERYKTKRNQPFYHLFTQNDGPYIAYVSQQNLLHDENLDPCSHPQINSVFDGLKDGKYVLKGSNLQ